MKKFRTFLCFIGWHDYHWHPYLDISGKWKTEKRCIHCDEVKYGSIGGLRYFN